MSDDPKRDTPEHEKLREEKTPRTQAKDSWSNAEETLSEPPAGSPKADDQARKS